MKLFVTTLFTVFLFHTGQSQLMISKQLGKNSGNAKLGYGTFANIELPLNEEASNSIVLELLDFAYFPQKSTDINNSPGYASIKLGYKHIFSETNTGFYIEPQAGWCRVVGSHSPLEVVPSEDYGDGLALAMETGYSLGVGQHTNAFHFSVKYENDMGPKDYKTSSIGLRISFSYSMNRDGGLFGRLRGRRS